MKKILPLIIFTLAQIPVTVFAQCTPAIPNTANVVSFTQTVNGGFTPQWVCSGDTLFSGGGIFFVYLETGGVMNTGGGIDTLYMKNGAVLDMNGGIHVIYHEPLAILNVAGGIPTYMPCSTITFDYTDAPSGGCLTTMVGEENAGSMSVSVFPNPATTQLTIDNGELKIELVEIYDVMGRLTPAPFPDNIGTQGDGQSERSQGLRVDITSLSAGIYFVKVKGENEERVAKFVKE